MFWSRWTKCILLTNASVNYWRSFPWHSQTNSWKPWTVMFASLRHVRFSEIYKNWIDMNKSMLTCLSHFWLSSKNGTHFEIQKLSDIELLIFVNDKISSDIIWMKSAELKSRKEWRPGSNDEFDLNMVEIMQMREALATDTKLVRGMVLDHGCAADRAAQLCRWV